MAGNVEKWIKLLTSTYVCQAMLLFQTKVIFELFYDEIPIWFLFIVSYWLGYLLITDKRKVWLD